MARIFITGSSDGLGLSAAKTLVAQGHQVVLHARNEKRAGEVLDKVPGADSVLVGDLANLERTKELASKVNTLGKFDAIIHNAGLFNASGEDLFAVNTLAPYILTCLIHKPNRLVYLSSDMHEGGRSKLPYFIKDLSQITYSDTKLHVLMLCKIVARKWHSVYANALSPGWVPTKMGGAGAPDDLDAGSQTQVWLAVGDDEGVEVSGRYFYHKEEKECNPEADNVGLQEQFMKLCEQITGVSLPL